MQWLESRKIGALTHRIEVTRQHLGVPFRKVFFFFNNNNSAQKLTNSSSVFISKGTGQNTVVGVQTPHVSWPALFFRIIVCILLYASRGMTIQASQVSGYYENKVESWLRRRKLQSPSTTNTTSYLASESENHRRLDYYYYYYYTEIGGRNGKEPKKER